MHDYWNRDNFPRLVWAKRDSNWHIYADSFGNCASIAVRNGAHSTGFGKLSHVADCKRRDALQRNPALLSKRETWPALARWSDWDMWRTYSGESAQC